MCSVSKPVWAPHHFGCVLLLLVGALLWKGCRVEVIYEII